MTFERAAECESIGGQYYDCDSAWPKEAIRVVIIGFRQRNGGCQKETAMFMFMVRVLEGIQRQRNVGGYDQPRTLGQLGQLIVFLLSQVELCVLFFTEVSISFGDFFFFHYNIRDETLARSQQLGLTKNRSIITRKETLVPGESNRTRSWWERKEFSRSRAHHE
ncbi:hypothetical protein DER46DRAFT_645232 [Fusarium sp. MPI-SDFR-AT-0072]|nr:hypothetical protein DER46DRAFT_645232 [Fusarium sp. MPI-SDFR-AT-0072]